MKQILTILLILMFYGCDALINDSESPSVSITYPIDDFSLDSLTTIKVDAVDNEEIAFTSIYINGEFFRSDSTAPYEFEWDVCAYEADDYALFAKAEDTSGNEAQSDAISVTVEEVNYDCSEVCGGADVTCSDECGVADGDNSTCLDECGVPNGDNSTCTGCDGIVNSGLEYDSCGNCDGDGFNDDGYHCGDFIFLEDFYNLNKLNTLQDLEEQYFSTNGWLHPEKWEDGRLIKLDVKNDYFSIIPESIANASELIELNFKENEITIIPESLFILSKLRDLDLSYNEISILSSNVVNLTALTFLNLKYNNLSTLPSNLCDLSDNCNIFLGNNYLCEEEYYYQCIYGYINYYGDSYFSSQNCD